MSKLRAPLASSALILFAGSSFGQAPAVRGVVAGVVTDPSGATVANAAVRVSGNGAERTLRTDAAGRFSLEVPPGLYAVTVLSEGFEAAEERGVTIGAGGRADLSIRLVIEAQTEEVTVPSDEGGSSTGAADNQSALVFKGQKLDALSSDDATLQKQLLAMAGSDGENPPQLLIDGFSGGRFPPKSSIREVRINQNPYSAQYDALGFGRIEVFTKPGSDKFHGFLQSSGNDASFNARNPYTGVQPAYHTVFVDGNVTGPVGKKTSFFASANYNNQQNNAVVNAVVLGGNLSPAAVSEAVPNPVLSHNYSARLDWQLTSNNTFTSRYEYNSDAAINGGVGLLTLRSEGYNSHTAMQTLQVGSTAVLNAKLISETRFQYIRTRLQQRPVDGTPTLIVQGSFNGGGANGQAMQDNQDRYEWQEYLSLDRGKHFLRAGVRYRLLRDSNLSTANYNGQYVFPDLPTYQATQRGLQAGLSGAAIRAMGGGATQFNLTAGRPSAAVVTGDLGVYLEDDWKLRKNLTVNLGLRFESQTAIPDHADPAPRVGFAWAVHQSDTRPAPLVVRGGFGVFYNRFDSGNILNATRQNGISQQSFYIKNPDFYPAVPPLGALTSVAPTVYRISPRLRSQYDLVSGISAEHAFGKAGSVTVSYVNARTVHYFLSRNVNAPLPGTYNPLVPTSGVRPLGGTQNVYEYASDGVGNRRSLYVNANLNPAKKISTWVFYRHQNRYADASGAGSFPSNEYDLRADYGTTAFTRKDVLFTGAYAQLPFGFSGGPFLAARSGQAFNITIGQDLNGDTQYNDRPAFATDLSRPSVVRTALGNFDIDPLPGQTTIPINYGRAPASVALQFELTKSFKFGTPPAALPAPASAAAKRESVHGPAEKPDPPYEIGLSVDSQNLLNHTNPGVPIGVLSSPFFGRSISLNEDFSGNTAANRTINLRAFFRF